MRPIFSQHQNLTFDLFSCNSKTGRLTETSKLVTYLPVLPSAALSKLHPRTPEKQTMLLILDFYRTLLHASSKHSAVRHRVQKTGKSRSLKKFGYTQDNALLFRPNCCPLLVHLWLPWVLHLNTPFLWCNILYIDTIGKLVYYCSFCFLKLRHELSDCDVSSVIIQIKEYYFIILHYFCHIFFSYPKRWVMVRFK